MSPIRMSRPEAAIRVVLELNELFNRHDVEGMSGLLSDDCVIESAAPAPGGAVYSGKAAAVDFFREIFSRSPAARSEIEEIFGFGSRCVARWKRGEPGAHEKKTHIRGVDLYRVKNDLICEILSYAKGTATD